MTNLLKLILGLQILLLVKSSTRSEKNSTTVTTGVDLTRCEKGKQFYDFDNEKCRKCPRCKKANNILPYNLKVSRDYGALECYPCYCKLGKKAFDAETKRCVKCPCNINGDRNTSVDITVDEWIGAMDCYPCICKHGFFATALTQYQCVGCNNCSLQNKIETSQCSPTKNAECGGCLDGYSKVDGMTCVKNTPAEDVHTTELPTKAQVLSPVDHGPTIQRSQIITVVILVIVICIAIVTVYLGYGYIKRRTSHQSPLDGLVKNSGSTMSSSNSVQKNVADNDHLVSDYSTTNHQKLFSTISATNPLLEGDTGLAQDSIKYHLDTLLPPGSEIQSVFIQVDLENKAQTA